VTDGYVASSNRANFSSTGSPTFTVPTGVQGGDWLVLLVSSAQAGVTVTGGSGSWTALATKNPPSGGSGLTCALYYKKAAGTIGGASSDVGATITVTPNTTGSKSSAVMIAVRGEDQTSPVDDWDFVEYDSASGTTFATPTVTTSVDGGTLVYGFTDKGSVTTTIAPPAGTTTRSSQLGIGTGRTDAVLATADAGTHGAKGGGNFTVDASPGQVVTWLVAFAPASTTVVLHPVSDVTMTNVVGVPNDTTKFANYDESVTNVGDYLEFVVTGVGNCGLTSLGANPGTSVGWSVELALGLGSGASSTSWTCRLYQGTTLIEQWTETVTADPTEIVHALSPTNIATISFASIPVTDLRIYATMTAAS
jgi:hypothetical protein